MESRGENPHSLAKKTKVPQPTIHRIETGGATGLAADPQPPVQDQPRQQ